MTYLQVRPSPLKDCLVADTSAIELGHLHDCHCILPAGFCKHWQQHGGADTAGLSISDPQVDADVALLNVVRRLCLLTNMWYAQWRSKNVKGDLQHEKVKLTVCGAERHLARREHSAWSTHERQLLQVRAERVLAR